MFVQALVKATNFTPLFANSNTGGLYSFASYMVPQFPQVISFLEIVSIIQVSVNGSTNKQTNKWQQQQEHYSNLAILTSKGSPVQTSLVT